MRCKFRSFATQVTRCSSSSVLRRLELSRPAPRTRHSSCLFGKLLGAARQGHFRFLRVLPRALFFPLDLPIIASTAFSASFLLSDLGKLDIFSSSLRILISSLTNFYCLSIFKRLFALPGENWWGRPDLNRGSQALPAYWQRILL